MKNGRERIFITGAAGMIGSNVARALVQDGRTVIGIDNLWRGTRRNLEDLVQRSNFTFHQADIVSDDDWYRDIGESDTIVHAADIVAGIGYVFSNEWAVFQKNLLINTRIAGIVHQLQPAQLIYLGTACSYPQSLQRSVETSVLDEASKFPADPESGYGWSKLIGEIDFKLAVKGTRTRLTVLDLHNVYGCPCVYGDATAQVIPSLIFKALKSTDGKLSVWGDGSQGRGFLHVTDVVTAVQGALHYTGTEQAFMIGPDRCTTIAELAGLIQTHPMVNIGEIVFDTSRPTGDHGRFADATLAERDLGWTPKVDLKQGLYEVIDWVLEDCKAGQRVERLSRATVSEPASDASLENPPG
jgi:GDP-D-mannose 3', 5'-epimerase